MRVQDEDGILEITYRGACSLSPLHIVALPSRSPVHASHAAAAELVISHACTGAGCSGIVLIFVLNIYNDFYDFNRESLLNECGKLLVLTDLCLSCIALLCIPSLLLLGTFSGIYLISYSS